MARHLGTPTVRLTQPLSHRDRHSRAHAPSTIATRDRCPDHADTAGRHPGGKTVVQSDQPWDEPHHAATRGLPDAAARGVGDDRRPRRSREAEPVAECDSCTDHRADTRADPGTALRRRRPDPTPAPTAEPTPAPTAEPTADPPVDPSRRAERRSVGARQRRSPTLERVAESPVRIRAGRRSKPGASRASLLAASVSGTRCSSGTNDLVTFGAARALAWPRSRLRRGSSGRRGCRRHHRALVASPSHPSRHQGPRRKAMARPTEHELLLGINDATGRLAADFEDPARGDNHPVAGTTVITNNVWHPCRRDIQRFDVEPLSRRPTWKATSRLQTPSRESESTQHAGLGVMP